MRDRRSGAPGLRLKTHTNVTLTLKTHTDVTLYL